jgi:flagellum-specific peptidoglycan hydrolase FlgJ
MIHIKSRFIIISLILIFLGIALEPHINITQANAREFHPTPVQDNQTGRNSHTYLPQITSLTTIEREAFVKEISVYAKEAGQQWGVPASAVIAIAIIESGYGTTRVAHHANNLFAIKVWGGNSSNAWQLIGQPDEDFEKPIPVIKDLGNDRKIYDETYRRDNWYRKFTSFKESVDFLAGTLLLNKRYGFAVNDYQYRIKTGWSIEAASKRYLFDIANAGYNHLGGVYYRDRVGKIMDDWNLYQYDEDLHFFRDIHGHWGKEPIERLAKLKIISGFNDGMFRPESKVTREQFVKMLVEAMDYEPILGKTTFNDVLSHRWSNPYIESAIRNGIIPIRQYGTNFEPALAISREEMANYVSRALSLEPVSRPLTFRDTHLIDNLALVSAVVQYGIIIGFSDQTFRPDQELTRAEAAVVITRILDHPL